MGWSREPSHCALGDDDDEDGEGDDDEEEEDDQDEADEADDDAAETDDLDIDEADEDDDVVACFASDCLSGANETAEPAVEVLVGAASSFLWSLGDIHTAHPVNIPDQSKPACLDNVSEALVWEEKVAELYEEGGSVFQEDNGQIEQWDEAQATELSDADGAGEFCAGNCLSQVVEPGGVACASAGSSGDSNDVSASSMPPLGPLGTNFMLLGARESSNGNDEGANDQSVPVSGGGLTISCHEEHHALLHHYCASAPLPQVRKRRGPVLCVCEVLQCSDQS